MTQHNSRPNWIATHWLEVLAFQTGAAEDGGFRSGTFTSQASKCEGRICRGGNPCSLASSYFSCFRKRQRAHCSVNIICKSCWQFEIEVVHSVFSTLSPLHLWRLSFSPPSRQKLPSFSHSKKAFLKRSPERTKPKIPVLCYAFTKAFTKQSCKPSEGWGLCGNKGQNTIFSHITFSLMPLFKCKYCCHCDLLTLILSGNVNSSKILIWSISFPLLHFSLYVSPESHKCWLLNECSFTSGGDTKTTWRN